MKYALAIVAALVFASPATATTHHHHRPHCSKGHVAKRVYVVRHRHGHVLMRHGHVVRVKVWHCVKRHTKPVVAPTVTAPTPPPPSVAAPATVAPSVVRADLDPAYTQDAADNLKVTWTYSATSNGTIPAGVLSLAVQKPSNGANVGGCTMNVAGGTTGGTCTVELPLYGTYAVTVTYAGNDPTVAPATQTDSETIEPLPATVSYVWGTDAPTANPTVTATVVGQTANVVVTDGDFEGATSVDVTDNLGDGCAASVSGTSATCAMPVTGTPAGFTIEYPGGDSTTGTRTVPFNGVQDVTYEWPAENVAVDNPTVTVQQATVEECGGQVTGVFPSPWPSNEGTCSYGSPVAWPNPLNVSTTPWVTLYAVTYGSLATDRDPTHGDGQVSGWLTFNVSGGTEGVDYTAMDGQGSSPDNSSDCSKVLTQAYNPSTGGYGPDEPFGGCQIRFSTPGTYVVTVTYTSEDGNYVGVANVDSETINVD